MVFARYPFFALVAALVTICSHCHAAEGGSGPFWPGYRNYLAGVVPPKPGLYIRNDVLAYWATVPRVPLNGLPITNARVNAALDIIEPEYVLPHKLWGANHAIVITQPFVWAHLKDDIMGTDIHLQGSRFCPGDPVVSPLFLGWQNKNLLYNTNIAIFVPNGSYDIRSVVNTSRNFWTLDFEFGVTQFDPKVGWDLSGVLGYAVNFENAATHYTSGNVLHLDFAIGKVLQNHLKPGISGFAWIQVTPDYGSGAVYGSYESRIFGIGPIVEMPLSQTSDVTLRYYHEFGARDHVTGDQLALSYRVSL